MTDAQKLAEVKKRLEEIQKEIARLLRKIGR